MSSTRSTEYKQHVRTQHNITENWVADATDMSKMWSVEIKSTTDRQQMCQIYCPRRLTTPQRRITTLTTAGMRLFVGSRLKIACVPFRTVKELTTCLGQHMPLLYSTSLPFKTNSSSLFVNGDEKLAVIYVRTTVSASRVHLFGIPIVKSSAYYKYVNERTMIK